MQRPRPFVSCLFLVVLTAFSQAQVASRTVLKELEWRNIGPWRGGRSCAVSGVYNQPNHFYMGTTGGGVWKTTDAGDNWENVSDGFFGTGSVGGIGVAPSDPETVYVGMVKPSSGATSATGTGFIAATMVGQLGGISD